MYDCMGIYWISEAHSSYCYVHMHLSILLVYGIYTTNVRSIAAVIVVLRVCLCMYLVLVLNVRWGVRTYVRM